MCRVSHSGTVFCLRWDEATASLSQLTASAHGLDRLFAPASALAAPGKLMVAYSHGKSEADARCVLRAAGGDPSATDCGTAEPTWGSGSDHGAGSGDQGGDGGPDLPPGPSALELEADPSVQNVPSVLTSDPALQASGGTYSVAVTVVYQWQVCNNTDPASCVNIAGANGVTYRPASVDAGKRFRVVVTAVATSGGDSLTTPSAITSQLTIAPANTTPATMSTSNPTYGVAVTRLQAGDWTGYPIPAVTYTWQRSADGQAWTTVSSAATYTPVVDDIGYRLRVLEHGSNSAGSADQASAASQPVTDSYDRQVRATSGMLAYYHLNETQTYIGAGNKPVAVNSNGDAIGYNATVVSNVTAGQTGAFAGSGTSFAFTGGRLSTNVAPGTSVNGLAFEMWLKVDTTQSGTGDIVYLGNAGCRTSSTWRSSTCSPAGRLQLGSYNGAADTWTSAPVSTGWVHVAAVATATTWELYINGTSAASVTRNNPAIANGKQVTVG